MKKLFLIPILFATHFSQAQTQFHKAVKIEFEKTHNVHSYYKDLAEGETGAEGWLNWVLENYPKVVTNYHEFTGDNTKSIYKPGREVSLGANTYYRPIADKNVVYTDFTTNTTIAQKPVFEETFLMQDSLSKIKWKLTADTRTIAGFECRKAVGILDDSIAVFAFYTDEILIPGGPEGIHGLPGMILGVGVPRLHATWFATKVDVFDVNLNAVKPETKGKKVNRATMMKSLGTVLRQWGSYGGKMVVNFEI